MKRLGVIGGLGPMATAYFFELLVKMTDAKCDQEHIETIIYSRPSIPDRTDYILGKSLLNPYGDMLDTGRALALQGADYIAIPCVTASYFYNNLVKDLKLPIINIVHETVEFLRLKGISSAGIMATDGTLKSGLFQKELEKSAITPIIPSGKAQKLIMALIYGIKAGYPVDKERFEEISNELIIAGAEIIILGCTELSPLQKGSGYVDALKALAARSILLCGARLKKEYDI